MEIEIITLYELPFRGQPEFSRQLVCSRWFGHPECNISDIHELVLRNLHRRQVFNLYGISQFRWPPTRPLTRHDRVMLSFDYAHIPSDVQVPVCCTFPARTPVCWDTQACRPVSIPRGCDWYRFLDSPNHLLRIHEVEEAWSLLAQDAERWAREKKGWQYVFQSLPDDLIRSIEAWMPGGLSSGRYISI